MNILMLSCFIDPRFKNSLPNDIYPKMFAYLDEVINYPVVKDHYLDKRNTNANVNSNTMEQEK